MEFGQAGAGVANLDFRELNFCLWSKRGRGEDGHVNYVIVA